MQRSTTKAQSFRRVLPESPEPLGRSPAALRHVHGELGESKSEVASPQRSPGALSLDHPQGSDEVGVHIPCHGNPSEIQERLKLE